MIYLSADYIFPVSTTPIKNAILLLEEDGTIVDVLKNKDQLPTDSIVDYHRGIICPGFVNAHCHLELSYLKGRIQEGKGLAGFIKELVRERASSEISITEAAEDADAEMVSNGIVLVGDIVNNDMTIPVKNASRIRYHSFIEIFDLHQDRADETFENGKNLFEKYEKAGLSCSIVPHAPYTVSKRLLKLISEFAYENNSLLCIHNQETEGENEMFLTASGKFLESLQAVSKAFDNWEPTGFRSLPSVFSHLPKCNKIQLVHNTFSTTEDIRWAHLYNLFVWWCICPNANMYIEKRLPDMPMFRNEVAKITVGTDSYASNKSLSILDELKCIQKSFPEIPLRELIKWGTLNGAEFMGLQSVYGSFEKGKRPGINLIANLDLEKLSLTNSSYVLPLI